MPGFTDTRSGTVTGRPRPRQVSPQMNERGGPWPEVRIVSQVNIDVSETIDWEDYLSRFGRLNFGKGKAFSVGSLACTFVNAQKMGEMMNAAYPNVFNNRKKTKELYRRFARNFNQFVAQQVDLEIGGAINKMNDMSHDHVAQLEEARQDPDAIYIEPARSLYEPEYKRWAGGAMAVKKLEIYSRNGLGLDLSDNDVLREQYNDIRDYLRSEQLNTSILDKNWQPHVVVFETFLNTETIMLKVPLEKERPAAITLDAPKALVNTY